jgi:single-strand DNA-binding protein
MNLLTIIGNLTADPVSRTTQAGKNVTTFTVAVNRRKTANAGQPEADFFRVAAWGALGESCAKYLSKGRKVAVIGAVQVSTYTAQDGSTRASLDIPFAENVEFLSPNGDNAHETTQDATANEPVPQPVNIDESELPF